MRDNVRVVAVETCMLLLEIRRSGVAENETAADEPASVGTGRLRLRNSCQTGIIVTIQLQAEYYHQESSCQL